jgi:muconate cycloisomerase
VRIVELIYHLIDLPLRKKITHASHTRQTSKNLLVCCRLADGTVGWGEGVPRAYVTGETPQGVLEQLAATDWAEQLDCDCENWADVIGLCTRLQPAVLRDDPRQCGTNAHRCAVELSLLDAYGNLFGEPVGAVTRCFEPARPLRTSLAQVRYSGAVTADSRRQELVSALKMRVYGFIHCKVKVGMPGTDDGERMQHLRRWLGRKMEVRIDANEAWDGTEVRAKLEPLLPWDIRCVEQPVPHAQVESLAEVRRQLPVPIMLDESLTSLVDGATAIQQKTCDLFNIRLSKCGGFLNSLRLAAMAHETGLGYQMGCHPGESGILSAAGRHFASTVRDILYREGSYDRHLLQRLITHEDITFGYGGRAPALTGPGLGVTVRRDLLARYTVRRQHCPLE